MNKTPFDSSGLRNQAERALRDQNLPSTVPLDPVRLLHELQVHQVELELQNEELVSANVDLDTLRSKYQALYESAPVGYLTLSATGNVVDCNSKALQMLALAHDAVLKHPLRECFDTTSHANFDALLDEAASDGASNAEELLLRRPKRIPMYVRAQTRLFQLPHHDEKLLLFVMMDVSALRAAIDDIASVIKKHQD